MFRDNRTNITTKDIRFAMKFLKDDINNVRQKRDIVKSFYGRDRYIQVN